MKRRLVLIAVTSFCMTTIPLFARGPSGSSTGDAFWVDFWAKPRVNLNRTDELAFYQNVHDVAFAHDHFDHWLDENTLNADVEWLKNDPAAFSSKATPRKQEQGLQPEILANGPSG